MQDSINSGVSDLDTASQKDARGTPQHQHIFEMIGDFRATQILTVSAFFVRGVPSHLRNGESKWMN